LLLTLVRGDAVDERGLKALFVRGIARPSAATMQILVGGPVEETAAPLRALL
jgi:hypothetical protein